MKKFIILFIVIFCCNIAYSQQENFIAEMEDNYLQIRQRPGTQHLLKKYLQPANLDCDTVYAILYTPMNCPRCEAYIRAFQKLIKENNTNNKLLIISAYPDATMASEYNLKNKYFADKYIYDTSKEYEKIFNFNSNGLYNTCILKISANTGTFITGGDPTIICKDFVNQFVAAKKSLKPFLYENNEEIEEYNFTMTAENIPIMNEKYSEYEIDNNGDFKISSVYDLPKMEHGKFFYTDVLNNGAMLYNVNKANCKITFNKLVQADSIEKRRFINVSEKIYRQFINSGSIFYIACGTSLLSSNSIGVSYSLPNLFYDGVQDTSYTRIGYRNEAAIVTRTINPYSTKELSYYDFETEKNEFFYAHYTFTPFDDKILIGCKKYTWPLEFEAEEYKDEVNRNSFCDKFYEDENPYMAVFDNTTGKLIARFGKMEDCQRKSLTGYYYVKPIAHISDKEILYGNGYTGQLYLVNKSDLKKEKAHFSAFNIDTSQFPSIDSTKFYTYEYVKPYNKYFSRCIESVKMNDTKIYCLVRYGLPKNSGNPDDTYTLITINKSTGVRQEKQFPTYPSNLKILGYGLSEDNNKISPFIFIKNNNKAIIRVFE